MAKLGGIYIDVRAKTTKLVTDLKKAETVTKKAAVVMTRALDQITFKRVALGLAAAGAVAAVVLKKSIELAKEQEAVEKRLESVLKSTGNAAGFNVDQLKDMASAMQEVTTVGDEMILKNMAILATFKQIRGEGFERATQAALDMSEVMQTDLQSSIVMIGKALNDPIANLSAMSRAGVQFTKTQKDMVKELWNAGRAAEAQNIILKELESQFGGAAKAARNTFGGAVQAAENALGDLQEQIGFAITKNKTFIDLVKESEQYFIDVGKAVATWVEANDKLIAQRTRETLTGIRDALQGIVDIYNAVPSGVLEAGGYGLIGKLLFGASVGKFVFVLSLINDGMDKLGMGLGDMKDKHQATGNAMVNLWNSIRDAITGANTEFKKATGMTLVAAHGAGSERPAVAGASTVKAVASTGGVTKPVKPDTFLVDSQIAAIKETDRLRSESWQQEIEWMNHIIEKEKEAEELRLEVVRGFNEEYAAMGKSRFDLEREEVERMTEIYREAGVEENRIAQMTSEKNKEIARAEQSAKLDIYQGIAGGVADTFLKISQAGIKQSREAFIAYKAFAIVEATIAGYKAVQNALATPLPWPLPMAMAGIAGAATAVQIGMIASSQMPSYDSGGISSARGMYSTGNIQEAHVPIPSGKIPVEINGGAATTEVVIMNTVDPSVLDTWAASARGKDAIFNTIGGSPQRLRRMVR